LQQKELKASIAPFNQSGNRFQLSILSQLQQAIPTAWLVRSLALLSILSQLQQNSSPYRALTAAL
jgi:hypothetical protein